MALTYITKQGYPELSAEFNSQNQTYVSVYADDINRQLVFIDEKTATELYRIPDTTADAVIVLGEGTGSSYRCGNNNNSSGIGSTVSGGCFNSTSGYYSAIVGGRNNSVSGYYSTASGYNNSVSGCYSSAFGCGLTASANYTLYANNFCACGAFHTSSILTGRSVCIGGVNGDELVGYIPTFPSAYNTVQDESINLPQRTTINFVGAGVTASDFGGVTTVNIPGGGGPAVYPTIQDEGVSLPIQPIIDFVGAGVTASNGVGKTIITIPGGGVANFYGSFYDTTIQMATLINTPYPMKLNTTDLSATNGISIVNDIFGNPTLITVANQGVYNLQFSAQLQRTSGGNTQRVDIWLRKNGVDLPDTNTHVNVQANAGFLVVAWNFFVNLMAGDNVQLMWSTTATTIEIFYDVPNLVTPHPATPSLILTMNRIS